MNIPLDKSSKKYTYKDYYSFEENLRCEIIDGVIYDMTPAPSRKHQEISGELFRQFANYLQEKPCKVYHPPFDVLLPNQNEQDEDITTVVQPDLTVVCDKNKLVDKGCIGAPDLIIEITSKSTALKDFGVKLCLYEKVGVKEYWIVQPDLGLVMIYTLVNGSYGRNASYFKEDPVKIGIFEDFTIDLKDLFIDDFFDQHK